MASDRKLKRKLKDRRVEFPVTTLMTSLDRVRVKGVQIHRSIIYGNTATIFGPGEKLATTPADHTHKWTVAVRSAASAPDSDIVGGADDISYFIKRVTFKLHDSYPNFTRRWYLKSAFQDRLLILDRYRQTTL